MWIYLSIFSLFLAAEHTLSGVEAWTHDNPVATAEVVVAISFFIVAGFVVLRLCAKPRLKTASEDDFRHLVAKSVLFSAIWGLVIFASLAIVLSASERVLTLLLPVFGTWIGTLLAYYFGKDNYESGARNSANLAKALTGMDKLRSIPVTTVMIRVSEIDIPQSVKGKGVADYGQVILSKLAAEMKRERLPLFDPGNGSIIGVLHKSLINEFLVKQGSQKLATATLQELLADSDAGKIAKESFVVLPNTATLADGGRGRSIPVVPFRIHLIPWSQKRGGAV